MEPPGAVPRRRLVGCAGYEPLRSKSGGQRYVYDVRVDAEHRVLKLMPDGARARAERGGVDRPGKIGSSGRITA